MLHCYFSGTIYVDYTVTFLVLYMLITVLRFWYYICRLHCYVFGTIYVDYTVTFLVLYMHCMLCISPKLSYSLKITDVNEIVKLLWREFNVLWLVICNRLVNLGISKQQHLYLKTKNLI